MCRIYENRLKETFRHGKSLLIFLSHLFGINQHKQFSFSRKIHFFTTFASNNKHNTLHRYFILPLVLLCSCLFLLRNPHPPSAIRIYEIFAEIYDTSAFVCHTFRQSHNSQLAQCRKIIREIMENYEYYGKCN